MSSNVPEESLQLKRVGLISFLITELHLLRVCNPLARSAGVFFKEIWNIHQGFKEIIKLLRRFKEIWNIHQAFKEIRDAR